MITVVKYGSEMWAVPKTEEDLLVCFREIQILLGTRLTDRISIRKLYKKSSSILITRAVISEKLRWL